MHKAVILIAVAAALAPAGSTLASEKKTPVNFHLDRAALSTDAGAEAIYKSMRAKAAKKCDARGERVPSAVSACADDLVAQWVEAVGDPKLTAVHEAAG